MLQDSVWVQGAQGAPKDSLPRRRCRKQGVLEAVQAEAGGVQSCGHWLRPLLSWASPTTPLPGPQMVPHSCQTASPGVDRSQLCVARCLVRAHLSPDHRETSWTASP